MYNCHAELMETPRKEGIKVFQKSRLDWER
jgi:hypothetical protein